MSFDIERPDTDFPDYEAAMNDMDPYDWDEEEVFEYDDEIDEF